MKHIPSSDLFRLLSIIPRDRGLFWRGVLQYGLWALMPIYTIVMLGLVTQQFEYGSLESLVNVCIWYAVGIAIFQVLCYLVQNIGRTELVTGYQSILHHEYMQKFVYLDTHSIEKIGTGRSISIIESGFKSRGMFISEGLAKVTSLFATLGYFMYLLVNMGWLYALSFVIIFAAVVAVSYKLNTYVLTARQIRVDAKHEYSKKIIRIIMSKTEMMQSWNQQYEMEKLDEETTKMTNGNKGMNPYLHWMFFGPEIVLNIVRITVFLLIGTAYFQGDVNLSLLVTIGAAFVLLDGVLDSYLMFFKDITKEFDIVKKLRRLFDNHQPTTPYDQGSEYIYKNGDIELKTVSFTYGEDSDSSQKLFTDFTIHIPGGKKTALVGPSGSGKSTLVKLIAGYLRPDSGDIYIDEQKLSETSLQSYYGHIGYLTQEPSVFDGTVRENLEYGMQTDSEQTPTLKGPFPLSGDNKTSSMIYGEQKVSPLIKGGGFEDESPKKAEGFATDFLHQAITSARCEFIYDLPHGLDTEIGERGVRLSGGQKQRLAIAKIFLKNPKIIILDEPTSALDSESEEAVTQAMNTLFEGRTVIIIAHRLQTVKHADNIIYIESPSPVGRGPGGGSYIAESGTHEQLIAMEGKYRKMVELQSGF